MENYIVSARKYRPQTFDSVIGQKSLTTTLKNAILSNRLAHAYLFCGPRGVGKTTCARIFAKTINCEHRTPQGEACNECESCKSFNEQRTLNIFELDAASNNGVDEMRQLVDQVRIPPQMGKYKVYIIDEVHMLSQAAFNAFLKTLEEPPHYVIFILATTEKHKILPTILSRCQVFDFNRIGVEDIVAHLADVAAKEGVNAEPDALRVIAQKADGGMRDALSIFDEVVSYTNGNLTYQSVIENLNVLDYEYYFKVTDLLLQNKVGDALLLLNDIINRGFNEGIFMSGMASHLRDLLVSKDPETTDLLEVGGQIRERYKEQAARCPLKFLYKAMKLCTDCDIHYKASKNKRLLVELTLIQMAQLTDPDSDEASGRGPTQEIAPIFHKPVKKDTAKPAPAAQNPAPAAANLASDAPAAYYKPREVKKNPFGPSIKDIGKAAPAPKPVEQEAPVEAVAGEDEPFDEARLQGQWELAVAQLPADKGVLAQRLRQSPPKLEADGTAYIAAENNLALQDIKKVLPALQEILRKSLHNNKLQLATRLSEGAERIKIYTPQEKYDLMVKKNPALAKLQEAFKLDLR